MDSNKGSLGNTGDKFKFNAESEGEINNENNLTSKYNNGHKSKKWESGKYLNYEDNYK